MVSVGRLPTDDELQEMIRVADADGSGSIDFYEFVALMANKQANPATAETVEAAFHIFDADGSGTLDPDELSRIMMNVGQPHAGSHSAHRP